MPLDRADALDHNRSRRVGSNTLVRIQVAQDEVGIWCAIGVDYGVHTQGQTFDDRFANIDEAARLHFEEELEAGRTIDVFVARSKSSDHTTPL